MTGPALWCLPVPGGSHCKAGSLRQCPVSSWGVMLSVSGKRLVTASPPGALRPGAQAGWLRASDFLLPTRAPPDSVGLHRVLCGRVRGVSWRRPHSALLSLPGDPTRPRYVLPVAPRRPVRLPRWDSWCLSVDRQWGGNHLRRIREISPGSRAARGPPHRGGRCGALRGPVLLLKPLQR